MGVRFPTGGPCRTGSVKNMKCENYIAKTWPCAPSFLGPSIGFIYELHIIYCWILHLEKRWTLYEPFNTTQDKLRTVQVDTSDRWTPSNLEATICTAAELCVWAAKYYSCEQSQHLISCISLRNTICRSFRMALQSLWGRGGGIKGFGFQFVLSVVSLTSSRKSTYMGWTLLSKMARVNSIFQVPWPSVLHGAKRQGDPNTCNLIRQAVSLVEIWPNWFNRDGGWRKKVCQAIQIASTILLIWPILHSK